VSLNERLKDVLGRKEKAAQAAGRDPAQITLIAVSKRQPLELVLEAYELGVRDFGENTAQGFRERSEAFAARGIVDARLHFIGHLQTNKVKFVVPEAVLIHSLDRPGLLVAIRKRSEDTPTNVLVQVNLGGETQKSGISAQEAVGFVQAVVGDPGVRFCGLMTLPPFGEDVEPYFRRLQELGSSMESFVTGGSIQLSMGMSSDFEKAIQCGATHIRVGTGIFGQRS